MVNYGKILFYILLFNALTRLSIGSQIVIMDTTASILNALVKTVIENLALMGTLANIVVVRKINVVVVIQIVQKIGAALKIRSVKNLRKLIAQIVLIVRGTLLDIIVRRRMILVWQEEYVDLISVVMTVIVLKDSIAQ